MRTPTECGRTLSSWCRSSLLHEQWFLWSKSSYLLWYNRSLLRLGGASPAATIFIIHSSRHCLNFCNASKLSYHQNLVLCNLETAVSRSMPQNLYNLSPKRAHIYNLSMWPTWGDLLCSAIYVSFTTRPKLCTEYTQSYHSPSQGVVSPERKYLLKGLGGVVKKGHLTVRLSKRHWMRLAFHAISLNWPL